MAFHEIDMDAKSWSTKPLPLNERIIDLICETFKRGGMASDIGVRLVQAFDKAGITAGRITREGLIETGAGSHVYGWISRVVGTLIPIMIKMGLVKEDEIDINNLATNLRGNLSRRNSP